MHVDRQMLMIVDYDGLRALLHGIPEPAYLPSPMIPEMIPTEPIQRIAETNDAAARWQSIGVTDR